MKKLFLGLIATVMLEFAGNAQTINDFRIQSESKISKTSSEGYYSKFITKLDLPDGVQISDENIILYQLNNPNYQMIELPITTQEKNANLLFVFIDLKANQTKKLFKNHQKEHYEFYDENLKKIYSLDFSSGKLVFTNEPEAERSSCYSKCRRISYDIIEGDFLSDLACQINPCGVAIAIYCFTICHMN